MFWAVFTFANHCIGSGVGLTPWGPYPQYSQESGVISRCPGGDKRSLTSSQIVRELIPTVGWCFDQFSHLQHHCIGSEVGLTPWAPYPQYPWGTGIVSRGSWCDERPLTTFKNRRKYDPSIGGCFISFLLVETIAFGLYWTQHPWDFSQRSPEVGTSLQGLMLW